MNAATATITATAAGATAATTATAAAAASLPALPVWLSPRVLLVAALSGSIALASMVVNDVFDWQIGSDRVNSPAKPLVSGAVHPYDAEPAAGCLYTLIVLAACQLEPLPLRMLVAGPAVGTYLYTPFLKRITLVKNVSVAAIIASSLLAGALAAGASFSALYRASGAFLFLFHALLYREVLMDVADVTGDASAGVPTLAVRLGKQRAVMVACGMLVLAHAAGRRGSVELALQVASPQQPWSLVKCRFCAVAPCCAISPSLSLRDYLAAPRSAQPSSANLRPYLANHCHPRSLPSPALRLSAAPLRCADRFSAPLATMGGFPPLLALLALALILGQSTRRAAPPVLSVCACRRVFVRPLPRCPHRPVTSPSFSAMRSPRHSTCMRAPFAFALCHTNQGDQGRPHQPTPRPALLPSRPCSPSPAASDVIRGASGQDVSATPPPAVATAIAVGSTFTFNFTAARCTNLPTTASSATVQWTSAAAATAGLPACENVTFLTGPDCTGVVASSAAKPSSPTTYTTRAILSSPYPLSALCYIVGDAPWWPTEVAARVVVATAVALGAYKVAFDPSSRCATVPAGTAPAGVSTPVSVQWGSSSSLAGGGASAPCNLVSFFPGTNCDGAVMQHFYSFSSSNPSSITPSSLSPLTTVRCKFSSNTACKYATCPANSVCAETSDNRGATCKCDKFYIGINGTCQDKCNLDCMANARCVRDASGAPDCVCNKGFQYAPDSNTCVDKCTFVDCGPNGKCIKDANGNATCACNTGFQMPPNNITCVDKCKLVTCAANSACNKDASGNTSCDCIVGFERLSGDDTCVDKCASVKCAPNGTCKRDAYGNPACSCSTGFKPSSDKLTCIDNCAAVNCGPGGTCIKDTYGNPFCNCTTGFKQSSNKLACIDNCASVYCGPGTCVKKENGDPTCSCNTGYQMSPYRLYCIRTECYNLGCEPDGTCVTNDGITSWCNWDSPCGTCPSGANCQNVRAYQSFNVLAPYCRCSSGYGMTSTGCVYGAPDQVLASSITLIHDSSALGSASRPYTFRFKSGCNQFPKEVAGNYKTAFEVHSINGLAGCRQWRGYTTDDCASTPYASGTLYLPPMTAYVA
ncbi:unnamed protein product, partial [Closterium sp. Naga37s-1]